MSDQEKLNKVLVTCKELTDAFKTLSETIATLQETADKMQQLADIRERRLAYEESRHDRELF